MLLGALTTVALLVTFGWILLVLLAPWAVHGVMADIYDLLIVRMTAKWYKAVLERLKPQDRLLDVGIGTASALAKNADLVLKNQLVIVGIDYEEEYIKKARMVSRYAGLVKQLVLHCKSIYDPQLQELFTGAASFDAAYFSGSLTLMPDPPGALQAAAAMLKEGGKIYITQTFQNHPSPVMERVKPLLKHLTTVDFGKLTYRWEVQRIIDDAGMEVLEDAPVPGSIDTKAQTARLIVVQLRSAKGAGGEQGAPAGAGSAAEAPLSASGPRLRSVAGGATPEGDE